MLARERAAERSSSRVPLVPPEAERIGLVNHVVPLEELAAKTRELAERLAAGPTWAVRWTKAWINKVLRKRMNLILDASLAFEALTLSSIGLVAIQLASRPTRHLA